MVRVTQHRSEPRSPPWNNDGHEGSCDVTLQLLSIPRQRTRRYSPGIGYMHLLKRTCSPDPRPWVSSCSQMSVTRTCRQGPGAENTLHRLFPASKVTMFDKNTRKSKSHMFIFLLISPKSSARFHGSCLHFHMNVPVDVPLTKWQLRRTNRLSTTPPALATFPTKGTM